MECNFGDGFGAFAKRVRRRGRSACHQRNTNTNTYSNPNPNPNPNTYSNPNAFGTYTGRCPDRAVHQHVQPDGRQPD